MGFLQNVDAAELLGVAHAVVEYDGLLRQYSGPLASLCAGDEEKIDAAYDALVAKARAAIAKATTPA